MSELVWIMYFADLTHSIKGICVFSMLICLASSAFSWYISVVEEMDLKKPIIWFSSVGIASLIVVLVTPRKEVIYAYAGTKAIESQLEQANINGTIQNDIYLLIRKKIKDELAEVEGEK